MMACFLCAVPALAETKGAYKETALTLPGDLNLDMNTRIQSLSVHGDQLDLFSERQTIDGKFMTRHFRSGDGGKTWKEQDLSWLEALGGDPSHQPWTGVRGDGTIYAMVEKNGTAQSGNLHYGYSIGTIAARKDGVTKTLCKLDNKDVSYYQIPGQGLSNEGDILLHADGQELEHLGGTTVPARYLVIDAATGQQKSSVEVADTESMTIASENGVALKYGKGALEFLDTASGKVQQTVKAPDSADNTMAWTSGYGAFYQLSENGLFRIRQGETDWTKLMDGTFLKDRPAGSDSTSCDALAVDRDGSVTMLLTYTRSDGIRTELTGQALKRFTPA